MAISLVDTFSDYRDNATMGTDIQPAISAQLEADARAVFEHISTSEPLDPEVARRVRERSEQATEKLRKTYGEINVAVDLIREIRDDE
jgi:hypothetical protein